MSVGHAQDKRGVERTTSGIDADVASDVAIVNGRTAGTALGVVPLHFLRNCRGNSNDERDDRGFDKHSGCCYFL